VIDERSCDAHQSAIATNETNKLLQEYDEEIYAGIKTNLDEKLKSKKDEVEQTRLRKRWLDWVGKYADKVGAMDDFSNEDKKEYKDGRYLHRIPPNG